MSEERKSWGWSLVAGALALATTSCAQLQSVLDGAAQLVPPNVSLKEVTLAEAPTQRSLSAYFCPRVLTEKLGLGFGAGLVCSQFFGRAPAEQQLKFGFDVRLAVQNPNRIPLPLGSILTAVNVYPGQQQSELGAACISLCSPEDPQCGARDANACPSDATDVTRREDIAQALGKLVLAEGARLASGEGLGIKAPEVVANGTQEIVVRLALDPQRLLPVMMQLARQSVRELQQGQAVSFAVPYALRGTLFTGRMGTVGSLSSPFGPVDGTWQPR